MVFDEKPCPDCGVQMGESHLDGCSIERCSVCGDLRVNCSCKDHDKVFAQWDGNEELIDDAGRRKDYDDAKIAKKEMDDEEAEEEEELRKATVDCKEESHGGEAIEAVKKTDDHALEKIMGILGKKKKPEPLKLKDGTTIRTICDGEAVELRNMEGIVFAVGLGFSAIAEEKEQFFTDVVTGKRFIAKGTTSVQFTVEEIELTDMAASDFIDDNNNFDIEVKGFIFKGARILSCESCEAILSSVEGVCERVMPK